MRSHPSRAGQEGSLCACGLTLGPRLLLPAPCPQVWRQVCGSEVQNASWGAAQPGSL